MSINLLVEDFDETQIPEKFRNAESGAIRLGDFITSYQALERKMSAAPSAPKSPDEYCIDCSHGLFEPDADVNRRMYELGLSSAQAQAVYDLAAEKLVPMIMSLSNEFQADREVEKLINHFGGPDQWKQVSRQLMAFGRQNLPGDVLDNLAGSYEGVLALYRLMKSGEPVLKKGAAANPGVNEQDLQSMMRDPRYWRDKDPAYVSKVTSGFQSLYGAD